MQYWSIQGLGRVLQLYLDLIQPKQDVNANLLMLNSNPEEFMKLLQNKKTAQNTDKVTRTVVYNNVRNNPKLWIFGLFLTLL